MHLTSLLSAVLLWGMFFLTSTLEALIEKGYRPFAATTSGKFYLIEDCRSPLTYPDPTGEKGSRIFVATGDNGFKSIRMSSRRIPPSEYTTSKFFDLLKNSKFNTKKIALQSEASDAVHFFYRTDTPAGGEVLNREWSGESTIEVVSGFDNGVPLLEPQAFFELMDLEKLTSEEERILLSWAEEFLAADCDLERCLATTATEVESFEESMSTVRGPFEFFTVESLRKLAAIPRPPKMLSHLVRKGELSVLFSSSGVGKSTLALQLAVNVARGTSVDDVHLSNEHPPATVMYFDLENASRTIAARVKNGFDGEERLHIVKQAVNGEAMKSPLEFVKAIQSAQEGVQADLIVIDNLSCFYIDGEKKSEANKLITPLHELAQSGPAVLAIAHTPKRDANTPIGLSDLSGSAQFGNRSDHVFALNATSTEDQVYLIEFKAREDKKVFEHEVLVMNRTTTDYGRGFEVKGMGLEKELLSAPAQNKHDRNREIVEHYRTSKSYRATAEHFGMGKSQIAEIVKRHS